MYIGVGGIPILVIIYSFAWEPVFGILKMAIPVCQSIRFTVGVNKNVTFHLCWTMVWRLDCLLTNGSLHRSVPLSVPYILSSLNNCSTIGFFTDKRRFTCTSYCFCPLLFCFCFVSFRFRWIIVGRLDHWLTKKLFTSFHFRFISVQFSFITLTFHFVSLRCRSTSFCLQYAQAHNAPSMIVSS